MRLKRPITVFPARPASGRPCLVRLSDFPACGHGRFQAEDYGPYSMMKHKGSDLAPLGTFAERVPKDVQDRVTARRQEILAGQFTVKVNDTQPKPGR